MFHIHLSNLYLWLFIFYVETCNICCKESTLDVLNNVSNAIDNSEESSPNLALNQQVNLKIVNCGGAYRDCIKRNGDKTWM